MKFTSCVAVLASVAGLASATTFTISVGENNGLTYDPPMVTGAVNGDVVAFQFKAKNHSVTQSTFAAPCTSSGVDSGFFPVQANASVVPQWSFTINNASAPLWFFCAQTGHCQKGMVFAVNPTAAKSLQAFQAAAMGNTTSNTTGTSGSSASPSASLVPSSTPTGGAMSRMSLSTGASSVGLLSVLGLVAGAFL